jgi:hypothetical protein
MTAQSGIWGFGPQVDRDTPPENWYRHAALSVGGGVLDEATVGPPEISGVPVPTAPHKTGYSSGGVVTYQPRFENVFGWILHGCMGDYDGGGADFDEDYISNGSVALTAAPQALYNTGFNALPVTTGRTASVSVTALGGASFSGTVTVNGTDLGDAPQTDDHVFLNAELYDTIVGAQIWKTITSASFPAWSNNGDQLSVGYESGVAHLFKFDAADPAAVKWMGMRKYIPQVNADPDSDLMEEMIGCKVLGMQMQAINRGLLTAQSAFRGRDFSFDDAYDPEDTDWVNEIEDYPSMPVSVKTDGYLRLKPTSGPVFTNQAIPVINAGVGITNTPVPDQLDRIYGDPRLYTLEIASRMLNFNVTLRWDNPEFYRACVTNSLSGSVWSEVPLVGAVDFRALSIANMPGETQPYGLRMQAPNVLFTLQGAIPLQGNQVVLAQYNGIAVHYPDGEYATMTLRNQQVAGAYDWPEPA